MSPRVLHKPERAYADLRTVKFIMTPVLQRSKEGRERVMCCQGWHCVEKVPARSDHLEVWGRSKQDRTRSALRTLLSHLPLPAQCVGVIKALPDDSQGGEGGERYSGKKLSAR